VTRFFVGSLGFGGCPMRLLIAQSNFGLQSPITGAIISDIVAFYKVFLDEKCLLCRRIDPILLGRLVNGLFEYFFIYFW